MAHFSRNNIYHGEFTPLYKTITTYDIRGNRKTQDYSNITLYTESISYSYNVRDMLTNVTKGSTSTSVSYRADGLRYSKTTPTKTVQYHYNLAGKVVSESDGTGNITANYVWGPDRTLVKKDSSGEYYYLYDGHGDVVQLIDRNGNVVNNYKYDEWGNTLSKNETVSNPFKYAGEIYDEETGLYYLKARYYDPIIGRFINEDKYEGTVTNPLSINVYTYVTNNPLLYVDPTGNISWRQFTTLFGGIADGLLGLSDLKSLFSWDALQGFIQFGKALLSGQVSFTDIAKAVGASFTEPFKYLAEHSKNVWTGKPSDQEVYEYGRNMGSVVQMIVGTVAGGGAVGGKIVQILGKVCPKLMKAVNKAADFTKGAGKAGRSNADLVQEIATRAEKKIGGTGAVAGTKKHAYARDLLDRYQSRYGNRGLETETSWVGNSPASYGTKGSARLDVYDVNTGDVYDYKFTTNPGNGLSQSQINHIMNNGPSYITNIWEVNP